MTMLPGKRSKAALKNFIEADDDLKAEAIGNDPRARELASFHREEAGGLEVIRAVFAGTGLAENPEKLRHIQRAREEIRKEWADARDAFLAIGRCLLDLERILSKTEFALLGRGTARLFPFSEATATQLRQIARAVDGGRIPVESCPGSYGTAYQITLLTEAQLQVARLRGLIRPDVTRREIQMLRREIAGDSDQHQTPGRVNLAKLREESARLHERRRNLAAELADIARRIAQIDELLSADITDSAA